MVSAERRTECPDIRAVIIVGSWARDEPTPTSGLDLVVLTDEKGMYLGSDCWIEVAVAEAAPVVRRVDWGPLMTERRLRLATGFEIEFGFASLAWASTDPVDPGTANVVRDGCTAQHDPDGIVADLLSFV